jgi:hypothetical protein
MIHRAAKVTIHDIRVSMLAPVPWMALLSFNIKASFGFLDLAPAASLALLNVQQSGAPRSLGASCPQPSDFCAIPGVATSQASSWRDCIFATTALRRSLAMMAVVQAPIASVADVAFWYFADMRAVLSDFRFRE